MFTIRFVKHDGGPETGYKSYSCGAYSVAHKGNGEAVIRMEMTTTDEPYIEEAVGDETAYSVAYITNSESRTIDVVRQLFAPTHD